MRIQFLELIFVEGVGFFVRLANRQFIVANVKIEFKNFPRRSGRAILIEQAFDRRQACRTGVENDFAIFFLNRRGTDLAVHTLQRSGRFRVEMKTRVRLSQNLFALQT